MNPINPYAGVPGCRSTHVDISGAEALLATGHPDSKQDEAAVLQPAEPVWAEVLVCSQQHHGSCPHPAAGLETWQSLVALLRCHYYAHHLLRTGEAVTTMPHAPCPIIAAKYLSTGGVRLVFVMPNVFSGQTLFRPNVSSRQMSFHEGWPVMNTCVCSSTEGLRLASPCPWSFQDR